MPEEGDPVKKWHEKGDNKDYVSIAIHLERKVRSLEAEKQLIENERLRLNREVRSIKSELDRMRTPPLVTAIVEKVFDDGTIEIKSSTGPRFLVKYSKSISPEELTPGTKVALNQRTFSVIKTISKPENLEYAAIRAWNGFPYELKIIEVHDRDEITPNLKNYFSIRLKSLEQLKEVAMIYRIPVIFKKDEEYLAIYYDTPLFWYKP